MTKRIAVWTGALALFLATALCALVLVRGLARRVRREFHHSIVASAQAATETSQAVPPRDPDFLSPRRLDAWQIIGPGGGGTFYNPAISPHDASLVFATTDMSSGFVSENAGRTWRSFNLRRLARFVFDPKLPNRVYAIAAALWRSDDRGHTWSLVYPGANSEVHYVDDEGEPYQFSNGGFDYGVMSFAVDPDDSNTLYVSMSEDKLEVSRDAGKNWKILAGDWAAQQLWIDPTSPRGNRTIYGRQVNVIKTWDGAATAKRPIEGVSDVYGAAFGIPSGGGKPVMYIASDYVRKDGQRKGGILASNDGGRTWRPLNDGIEKLVAAGTFPGFTTMAASRNHAEVVYVSYTHLVPPNAQTGYHGVLRTSDGGATWTVVRQETGAIAANMHNDWTSQRFGADFGDEPLSMGVDDNNPDLIYTGDLARLMRSTDGGKNWYGVFSQSTGKGYATTGLDDTTCYGIHFDPFDASHVFIGYTDIGLMRSEDGGESWVSATAASPALPHDWRHNTYWVEFDPAVKGKMWAVMTSLHDLPRLRELGHYGPAQGGVAASVDGGKTWTPSSHGLTPSNAPTHILLDPKSPEGARVLYLASLGRGVYKSTDGGQSWVAKNAGLPQSPLTWRMALGSDGALYVVTIRRSQDGKYGNDQDGWLFRSRNGAESWERVPLPDGVNGPVGITADPLDPARLYLSAWGRYTLYDARLPAPDGGVYLSTDSGRHWQNVLNGSRRIYDVTVDARNPDLVYAAGFEAAAWRSNDRGKTWKRIPGFNFPGGHRVVPDPVDINKIYITTMGNSVWHGPATGDPNATEDIVAPPGMRFQSKGQ